MDSRAAKLELARKKLKDHQEKKHVQKFDPLENVEKSQQSVNIGNNNVDSEISVIENQENDIIKKSENTNERQNLELQHKSHNQDTDSNENINVTEILISNKRNLEVQVMELQSKLDYLESAWKLENNHHNNAKQKISNLESELSNVNDRYLNTMEQIQQQNIKIKELNDKKTTLFDENNNLVEQLEFTKTILTAKETENASLHSQLDQIHSEQEVLKLQLQQLINGSNAHTLDNMNSGSKQKDELLQKIDNLELQLKLAQKEKDQININYEHYVGELNEQLRFTISKNEELLKQVNDLSNRESSLIDQISDMEIRIQNLQLKSMEKNKSLEEIKALDKSTDINHLINECSSAQKHIQGLTQKYEQLQSMYAQSEAKIIQLQEEAAKVNNSCDHDNISITKLTADIASDKIAAQKATEQNKKLKTSVQELEDAFVKMSQDKLQLTEKITAEKFLNRELTIKLAESEDKFKDMYIKLKAKDDEMIRLQATYRDLEMEYKSTQRHIEHSTTNQPSDCNHEKICDKVNDHQNKNVSETEIMTNNVTPTCEHDHVHDHNHDLSNNVLKETEKSSIPKGDAMVKLQERFLKIMGEVADLSDEKHRLEHIILQLQNETDTICEYVALYQQQRSLLKKRDEERSSQIKLFQIECDRLKRQLEELSGILLRFAEDEELSTYFQVETRKKDMEKVRNLLFNLKTNSLVDPKRSDLELNNVYPCNCCSGKLIDI